MANKQINAYAAATTIDASVDYLLIDPNGTGSYNKINRNTLLGITSQPLGLTDIQSPTNKTFDNTTTLTIKDANFILQDDGGTTRQAKFQLSSITAGQTRTVTLPDSNTTLPIVSQVVTISGPTAARTYTFPDAAATIPSISSTSTFTNKTMTASSNVLGGVTMTLGSDATGDVYYRSGGVLTRLGIGTAGQVLAVNGGATAPTWSAAGGVWTLLKANSGTDTSAGATNVDTYAISGLTAKDTLKIFVNCDSVTQDTASAVLYSTTDSAIIQSLNATNIITAGKALISENSIRQSQGSSTRYDAIGMAGLRTLGGTGGVGVIDVNGGSTMATAWTGSWTIALRHGGVTAGGTYRWSWSVFKIAGQ